MLENCCVCLEAKGNLSSTSQKNSENIAYELLMRYLIPELDLQKEKDAHLMCDKCIQDLEEAAAFKKKCLKSDILKQFHQCGADQEDVGSNGLTDIAIVNKYSCQKCEKSFQNGLDFEAHNIKFHDIKKLIKHRQIKVGKDRKEKSTLEFKSEGADILKGDSADRTLDCIISNIESNCGEDFSRYSDPEDSSDSASLNLSCKPIFTSLLVPNQTSKLKDYSLSFCKSPNLHEIVTSQTCLNLEKNCFVPNLNYGNHPYNTETKQFETTNSDFASSSYEGKQNSETKENDSPKIVDDKIGFKNAQDGGKHGESKPIMKNCKRKLSNRIPYIPEKEERDCRVCGRTLGSHVTLMNHLKKVHPCNEEFKCSICGETFRNADILQRHINRHTGDRKFVCSYCGKNFFSHSDLDHHIQRHLNKRKYKCNECDNKSFNTASSLRTHKLVMHSDRDTWKYLCTICGRKCISKTILDVHVKRHSNLREFGCHLCNRRFVTKAELNKHVPSHSNLRMFKCPDCSAEYKNRWVMEQHKVKKHGAEGVSAGVKDKNHPCTLCSKKFQGKKQLEKHLRSHNNDRPFKCQVCAKAFICNSYLKGHLKNKHAPVEREKVP